MKLSTITGRDNYFEDFPLGRRMRHARGKTVGELENVLVTNLVMNSADAHFNADRMKESPWKRPLSYGGANLALVLGLAAQDTAEQALAELGLDKIRFTAPVFHGDTLYAESEVLQIGASERADAGQVRFRHVGINQGGKTVVEAERTVLLKRRSHWAHR